MIEVIQFEPFQKIARLKRTCVISEKIDGTNAQVIITEDGRVAAGSRTRLITPGKTTDNFGFAAWVEDNKEELLKLGPGRHFGEWWGKGVQRGYGLQERVFSLFNTSRWSNPDVRPACCSVVPVLHDGDFDADSVDDALRTLKTNGSLAAPGFMDPEGIVVYHVAANNYFKVTLDGDGHKGVETAA